MRLLEELLEGKLFLARAPRISSARLFVDGTVLGAEISPPATSVTRYELDFALWKAAEAANTECRQEWAVKSAVRRHDGYFQITCAAVGGYPERHEFQSVLTRGVVDATGRWSNLRDQRQLPAETWVGLKAHFDAPENTGSVDLYFFPQGYCGVAPIGDGRLNACAMVRASAGIGNSLEKVFTCHPELARQSRKWKPAMDVVATAPLFFRIPCPLRDGMLVVGDAAGFVDPFIGDGISMALNSGVLAAESLAKNDWSAEAATRDYARAYQQRFLPVFRNAARVRKLLAAPRFLRQVLSALAHIPGVTGYVLQSTRLKAEV